MIMMLRLPGMEEGIMPKGMVFDFFDHLQNLQEIKAMKRLDSAT
jgi:hypothetical protein